MMTPEEAHRFKLVFFPIKVSAKYEGQKIKDTIIRVSLFREGENTGIGNSVFASGNEYPEDITWSIEG
jgi:hypothetical protein